MGETLDAEFYRGNRDRLRTLFQGTAPVVITAHGALQQGADAAYAFHQDSSFLYLTGIEQPDIVLVMDKEKEYLILSERSDVDQIFNGAYTAELLSQLSGIAEVLDQKQGWKKLTNRLRKAKHVATLAALPSYIDVYGFYTNPARAELMTRIKECNPAIEPLDLRQHLAVMRMVKQEPEIAAIQKSIDATMATLKQIHRKIGKFDFEYQIEAALSQGFRHQGTQGHGYHPIVAGGRNACTLHYNANNDVLQKDELLLIDAAAQINRYSADITRTWAVNEPTKRQRAVWQAVEDVFQFAFAQLKPGISIREYEKITEQFMGEKLRSLGLIRNVEHEDIRKYFPHATSHFLGLDVHDGGDYDRPLEAGVVLTVEPGIYIPEENLGVRIEDDVLITADGAQNLSASLKHDLY